MVALVLWCILFFLSWPLAILALVAYPFVWLLTAIFMLPVRLLRGPSAI